jgi:succinate dehydrogenase / fumarate reductase, cytochrome b subunit
MQLLTSNVGRKILMAVTGLFMLLFAIVHLLGNSSIFAGPNGINAYAEHLHSLGPVVWIFRLAMLAFITVHVIFGIQLTLENSAANPKAYAVKNQVRATLASNNMIWTGLLIAVFIIYHLLHFTARVTPGLVTGVDALNRFDVFTMVVSSFSGATNVLIYVAAIIVLFLHLFHGAQSIFQTVGLNNDKSLPVITKAGRLLSAALLIGYISIPVVIISGILK